MDLAPKQREIDVKREMTLNSKAKNMNMTNSRGLGF